MILNWDIYKKNNSEVFEGMDVVLAKTIRNRGGDEMLKGERAQISGSKRNGFPLTLTDRRRENGCVISITHVSPEDIKIRSRKALSKLKL